MIILIFPIFSYTFQSRQKLLFLPQNLIKDVFMDNNFGLYIHIPFCKSKCPYCDFYSFRADEKALDIYTENLCRIIIEWSKKINRIVTTIYFGGGTPSILGSKRLCKILNCIKNSFTIESNAEITAEVNPDSGIHIDFSEMKSCGFNRLSIGMQSAQEDELKALGRIHTANQARETVEKAKKSGFDNISLDLMMGIPHQTVESLKKSINFCFDCGVTHISSYILKVEKGTGFDKIKDKLQLADDDKVAELYLSAVSELERLSYKQYEISNFAIEGFESRHNTNYWKCCEYLGIGPSAHSFLNGKRFYYDRDMQSFFDNKLVFDCYGGDEEEFIMLSLRLKTGLEFSKYKEKFNKEFPKSVIDKAKNYQQLGLVTVDDNKISLTPNGFLVSNSIISELI